MKDPITIHLLASGERDRFERRWRANRPSFVDDPAGAVVEAKALADEVMRAQGYPVADFERYAAEISAVKPRVVAHVRAVRAIALAAQRGVATFEDLRQAAIHYRDLFNELLTRVSQPPIPRT